jgi:D-serine deaminase-like pyridoxal phosphate-dependent protein
MESIKESSFMANKGMLYPDIDTPALLVDLDKLDENIREMTQVAKDAGVKLRPHIKVHESSEIAKMQIEAGAVGIEVGPISMAEAMPRAESMISLSPILAIMADTNMKHLNAYSVNGGSNLL